jgi:hypothetical protein
VWLPDLLPFFTLNFGWGCRWFGGPFAFGVGLDSDLLAPVGESGSASSHTGSQKHLPKNSSASEHPSRR